MTSKYTEIEIYKPITYNSYTAASVTRFLIWDASETGELLAGY